MQQLLRLKPPMPSYIFLVDASQITQTSVDTFQTACLPKISKPGTRCHDGGNWSSSKLVTEKTCLKGNTLYTSINMFFLCPHDGLFVLGPFCLECSLNVCTKTYISVRCRIMQLSFMLFWHPRSFADLSSKA